VLANKTMSIHKGRPFNVGDWIGKPYGSIVEFLHGKGYLLKPSTEDLMMKTSRQSGIIYPKDAGYFILKAGIGPGKKVMEVGCGSGALTGVMATLIRPTGHVHSFDIREDFIELAKKNIARSRVQENVTFHLREKQTPFCEQGFDAAVLDIPTPWEELAHVKEALKGGGVLISMNPTYNQIENMAEALNDAGFIRVEAGEIFHRRIMARAGKTRPDHRMVAHTEFIVSATKVLD